jgi:hypothetical protein
MTQVKQEQHGHEKNPHMDGGNTSTISSTAPANIAAKKTFILNYELALILKSDMMLFVSFYGLSNKKCFQFKSNIPIFSHGVV